jgi:hypothetical protein
MASLFSKRGCAMGCGSLLFVVILAGTGVFISFDRHFNKAADLRVTMEEKYGKRSEWNPGSAPALNKERLERFLTVRRALQDVCADMTATNQGMASLPKLDGEDDVPDGEVIKAGWQTTRSMFGMVGNLGDFAIARNKALLSAEMGMGEYTWIYTLVYYGVLGKDPILGMGDDRPGNMPPGARKDLIGMMRAHAEAQDAAGSTGHAVPAAQWKREASLLESEPERMPFAGQAPEILETVVAPHAEELAGLFCRANDALELMRIKRHGIGYGDND